MARGEARFDSAGNGVQFYPEGNGEPLKNFRQGRWRDLVHFRKISTAVWIKG